MYQVNKLAFIVFKISEEKEMLCICAGLSISFEADIPKLKLGGRLFFKV